MAGTALDALRNDFRAVELELAAITKAKRLAVPKRKQPWFLTESVTQVILIIFTLADTAVDPAIIFLREAGRRRGKPAVKDFDWVTCLKISWGGVGGRITVTHRSYS